MLITPGTFTCTLFLETTLFFSFSVSSGDISLKCFCQAGTLHIHCFRSKPMGAQKANFDCMTTSIMKGFCRINMDTLSCAKLKVYIILVQWLEFVYHFFAKSCKTSFKYLLLLHFFLTFNSFNWYLRHLCPLIPL